MDAFFYGLYMDEDVLRSLNIEPKVPRVARIDGFDLDLRGAVKAIPCAGQSVWGIIFELSQADVHRMYSGPKTRLYTPSVVRARTDQGEELAVTCYNQVEDATAEFNVDYFEKLMPVMEKANLPPEYVRHIQSKRSS